MLYFLTCLCDEMKTMSMVSPCLCLSKRITVNSLCPLRDSKTAEELSTHTDPQVHIQMIAHRNIFSCSKAMPYDESSSLNSV